MEQIHDRIAGLDVHRDQVTACARLPGPRGGARTEKARFGTTAGGLAALAEWLAGHAVTLAAMEATGVYWKPVYYALEDRFPGLAAQRPSRQERSGTQDRYFRC
jgi:transposase